MLTLDFSTYISVSVGASMSTHLQSTRTLSLDTTSSVPDTFEFHILSNLTKIQTLSKHVDFVWFVHCMSNYQNQSNCLLSVSVVPKTTHPTVVKL